jgi:CcmD family protein
MISFSLFLTIFAQTQISDPNRFNQFLILAYVAIWAVAFLYLLFLANRQRNARKELQLLQQLLEEDQDQSPQ